MPGFRAGASRTSRVVALHRGAGRGLPLAAATPENQNELDALLEALRCSQRTVIRLDAPPEVGVARLTAREPADWSGLPQLREIARKLGARLDHLVGVDYVMETHRSPPDGVVADLRRLTAS
jgi:hypothetical protein